jgi:predicted regulator of Ras-like GTPase activity (Roadblock/LC7/MglB family)
MVVSEASRALARDELTQFLEAIPNISGVMVATADGHPIAHILQNGEPSSIAAIFASALGLGQQVADLVGPARLEEATIRSGNGSVAYYAVGNSAVLCVLAQSGVNLARVHLEAREVTQRLAGIIEPELIGR